MAAPVERNGHDVEDDVNQSFMIRLGGAPSATILALLSDCWPGCEQPNLCNRSLVVPQGMSGEDPARYAKLSACGPWTWKQWAWRAGEWFLGEVRHALQGPRARHTLFEASAARRTTDTWSRCAEWLSSAETHTRPIGLRDLGEISSSLWAHTVP